ncbi:MAG TPA: histidine kinase, partial [Anaerolineaceae bacterium]|nr:histidine kinase [Anaerolineaceae bacterium]
MRNRFEDRQFTRLIWPILAFGLMMAFSLYLQWSGGQRGWWLPTTLPAWVIALTVSFGVAWLVWIFAQMQARQDEILRQGVWSQRQLTAVVRLNQLLVDAQDEKQLVESSLAVFSELSGAAGSSFLPLDEWGQPLPAFTYGKLPAPVLRGWAEHLTEPAVHQQCRSCHVLKAQAGTPCPLMETPFGGKYDIYCLPMWHNERMIGMLNLYLPPQVAFPLEQQQFIETLLREMILAMETLRLRNQELATLRHLQLLRGSQAELSGALTDVAEGIREALDFDTVYLDVRPTGESFPGLRIARGETPWLETGSPVEICQIIYQDPAAAASIRSSDGLATLLAVPLRLPEGNVVGALLVGNQAEVQLHLRQESLLFTVAAQAAKLIENERILTTIELRSVLQERTRLSREIHDGLAQTLAFLKLNAAQMQTYLARQDLDRLEQALRHSYQTLTEAYLDTRQVIDQLRLSPEQGMATWLEQICTDFEEASGLQVQRSYQFPPVEFSQEVQSQLMRIFQEALTNVRKHAHARQITVQVRTWQGDFLLEVQ